MQALKTALVTGSTSGIGQGIARALAKAGYHVLLNGFGDTEQIEQQRIHLAQSHGVDILYHGADLTQPEQIEALIQYAADRWGKLDVLVNNAGMQYVAAIEDFPPAKWDLILTLNLTAAFHTTRLAIPMMKQQGWGRVINIASAHALVASPYKSAYVAAKHGLAGLTKAVALEVAQSAITVNAICPGYVWTPLVEGQVADTAKARGMSQQEVKQHVLLAAQPTKVFSTIEQLGELVMFLCSDSASNMTGSLISMDGGWTAQ